MSVASGGGDGDEKKNEPVESLVTLSPAEEWIGAEQGARAQQAPQRREIQCRDASQCRSSQKHTDSSLLKTQIGADNSPPKT